MVVSLLLNDRAMNRKRKREKGKCRTRMNAIIRVNSLRSQFYGCTWEKSMEQRVAIIWCEIDVRIVVAAMLGKHGVKTGLRAINLKENVFCLHSVFWCASVKITTAEGRKIIVESYLTYAHTDFFRCFFFRFSVLFICFYLSGTVAFSVSRITINLRNNAMEKLYFAAIHLHFMAPFALQMHGDSNILFDIHLHPILYGQKLKYFVNQYHSLISIESKRWRRITLCKILAFSCDISWSIKSFML